MTSQDRLAIQKPTLNPTTCDFRSALIVVVMLGEPSATEGGGGGSAVTLVVAIAYGIILPVCLMLTSHKAGLACWIWGDPAYGLAASPACLHVLVICSPYHTPRLGDLLHLNKPLLFPTDVLELAFKLPSGGRLVRRFVSSAATAQLYRFSMILLCVAACRQRTL
jgi:hypothetical protein